MRRRDRLLAIVAAILVVGSVRLAQEVYRWYAFSDERVQIARVESELHDAGIGVIQTQVKADSLRLVIESIDRQLEGRREQLDQYERQALRGRVSRDTERPYRQDLASYNARVRRRNEVVEEWRATVDENHLHVQRYNVLADSLRGLAAEIGEPYYPILTPAEIAERRGMLGDPRSSG